jgi:3-oxoacyl-[acyl-carrier protein] reductase
VVIARRGELLQTLQAEIVGAGGPCPLAMALDVTDPNTPQAIVDETQARFGRLDILINNAGGSRPTAVDAPDEVWEESWTLHFTAVRRLTQACLPVMQQQRWGRIIHITGSSEPSGINAANPAKAAVHVWAKGLSRVVGRDGITVNGLAPGRLHREPIDQCLHPTEESQQAVAAQIPLGSFGDPADRAYLVACLCSPNARDITRERLLVDGGYRRASEPAGRPGRAPGWCLCGPIARQPRGGRAHLGVGVGGLVAVACHHRRRSGDVCGSDARRSCSSRSGVWECCSRARGLATVSPASERRGWGDGRPCRPAWTASPAARPRA